MVLILVGMIILVDTMFSSLVVSDCAGLDGLWKDVTPGKVKPFQFIWDSRKPFFKFWFLFSFFVTVVCLRDFVDVKDVTQVKVQAVKFGV